jgi:sporulation protein YlmC with PRC-barrel domain
LNSRLIGAASRRKEIIMNRIWIIMAMNILLLGGVAQAAEEYGGTAPNGESGAPPAANGSTAPESGSAPESGNGSAAPESQNGGATSESGNGGATPSTGNGAPVAGTSTIGVAPEQMDAVVAGWSAKRDLLGKDIYNEQNQKIGKVDDMIVAPDKSLAFAIVGTGGFVGVRKHDVAIPTDQIKLEGNKFVLAGASKEALKQLPQFEYTRKQRTP